jgi:hypothetical protein
LLENYLSKREVYRTRVADGNETHIVYPTYCGIFAQSKKCGAREAVLLGNGFVTCNNGVFEAVFSVLSVPRLYTEDELWLRESLETVVRRV